MLLNITVYSTISLIGVYACICFCLLMQNLIFLSHRPAKFNTFKVHKYSQALFRVFIYK